MARHQLGEPASLEHVLYEFAMFVELLRLIYPELVPGTLGQLQTVRSNAEMEALLVHVRNLLEFFKPPSGTQHESTMRAQHYDRSSPALALGKRSLAELEQRLHNDLSHLTLDRLEREDDKTTPLEALDVGDRRWPPDTFVPFLHQCEAFLRLPGVGEKVKKAKPQDRVLAAQLAQICAEAVDRLPPKKS